MSDLGVEEIVALIEKALADESGGWIDCQEFQASELRALVADWSRRGEEIDLMETWLAGRGELEIFRKHCAALKDKR